MEYLNYEKLVENSLLNVVKDVLSQVKEHGLKEPHHFYVTFLTKYPGVQLPAYLLEEYPKEITIVLQYQFWDIQIQKDGFSVVLSFNDEDEKVRVPFKSIVSFSDPSQNFSLEFNPQIPKREKKPTVPLSNDSLDKQEDNVVSLDHFRKK